MGQLSRLLLNCFDCRACVCQMLLMWVNLKTFTMLLAYIDFSVRSSVYPRMSLRRTRAAPELGAGLLLNAGALARGASEELSTTGRRSIQSQAM